MSIFLCHHIRITSCSPVSSFLIKWFTRALEDNLLLLKFKTVCLVAFCYLWRISLCKDASTFAFKC